MVTTRDQVVKEARSFIGTPYVKRGMCKGKSADCYTFIVMVMIASGLIADADLPAYYSEDWWQNASDQMYLRRIMKFARAKTAPGLRSNRDVTVALPGDIILVRVDKMSPYFNHAGIIAAWPRVIHSTGGSGVQEVNAALDVYWRGCEIAIFDPFAGPETTDVQK